MTLRILKFRLMESNPDQGGSTSSPSTPTPSTPSNDSSSGEFDFAGLASHDDSDSAEPTPSPVSPSGGATQVTTPPAAASTTQQPPATSAPPAAPVPPVVAPPPPAAPPAAAQAQPASPTGQPPGQSPPAAPDSTPATPTKEQVAQTFAQHREQFLPKLQQLYTFDPVKDAAAIEELRTDPVAAMPKLAAQVHYEVQMAVFQSVMEALPQFVGQIFDHRAQVDKFTTQFKEMWPALHEKPEYEAAAENAIRVTRQNNPKMPMDQVLKNAGMLAMLSLGLPLQAPTNVQGTTAPAAPVPPAVRVPPPGRPAGVSTAGGSPLSVPNTGEENNIFEELANAHLRGDI